ncbi:MAG: aspartate kinase [Bacteroidales bacterium]|nr:aspartate kinase [Bacteroidales bacterium]
MIRKIYKFGGASVKDADAVRNLKQIVENHKNEDILLVVSAMGKMTNAFEKVLADFRANDGQLGWGAMCPIMEFHEKIITDLFEPDKIDAVIEKVTMLLIELYEKLQDTHKAYDYQYDQTVCYGELISTTIIAAYLNESGIPTRWLDARQYVITDDTFRSANPDWNETRLRIQKLDAEHIRGLVCLTQGFIGSTNGGKHATTLGREGSDFTAAIFANCLDAEEVTIWKDVDGLLNADPKRFKETVKIPHISYSEAIELAFYGASIIHPKTIKPLQNKNIRLNVQSFVHPDMEPSVIDGNPSPITHHPSSITHHIVKDNQTLVSISPRDFSFMNEHNLKTVFEVCDELRIHANMMQTSALMLSLCFDHDDAKREALMESLGKMFSIKYNENLQLYTIRHYEEGQEKAFIAGRKIYLEQRSRATAQFVIENA